MEGLELRDERQASESGRRKEEEEKGGKK